jgi:hypothetical protein
MLSSQILKSKRFIGARTTPLQRVAMMLQLKDLCVMLLMVRISIVLRILFCAPPISFWPRFTLNRARGASRLRKRLPIFSRSSLI